MTSGADKVPFSSSAVDSACSDSALTDTSYRRHRHPGVRDVAVKAAAAAAGGGVGWLERRSGCIARLNHRGAEGFD